MLSQNCCGPLARTRPPNRSARSDLEAEDVLIKSVEWNPALHPRAGAPPNPGWFAPSGSGTSGSTRLKPTQGAVAADIHIAVADESMLWGRKPEPPLSGGGGGNRGWGGYSGGRVVVPPPTRAIRPLDSVLAPRGEPIGVANPGTRASIRTVSPAEFDAIRSDILSDAVPASAPPSYPGTVFERPDGSLIGIRESLENGTTIDVLRSTSPAIPNGFRIHQK